MEAEIDIESLKLQLKRYLVLGSDTTNYTPGDRVSEPQFRPSSLAAIDELIALEQINVVVDVAIETAKNPYHDPVLLTYVLALASKSKCEKLRCRAYGAVPTLCSTSEQLFLFIKFLRELVQDNKGKIWGEGCRKAITKWYNCKDAATLTHILATQKQYYGFSHKDVLKLIHYKASTPVIDAVIKHFAFGKDVELPEELQSVRSKINELKTTEDAFRAAYLLSNLKLGPGYVPLRFAKSPQMWTEYIKHLPLIDLLHKLEFFTASRLLSGSVLPAATTILNDSDGDNLDPAEIYVALRRYEVSAKFLRKEKAIAKRRAAAAEAAASSAAKPKESKGKVKTIGPKACATVVDAVKGLLERSLKALPAGQTKWVVGLDLTDRGGADCPRLPGVSSAGAAALTLQWVDRSAGSIILFTSGKVEIKPDLESTVAEMTVKLRGVKAEPQTLSLAITNAVRDKIETDSFLILSDLKTGFSKALADVVKCLDEYRIKLERPQARLVVVFLRCHHDISIPDDQGLLVVRGFDARVPRLIQGFGNNMI